MAHKKLQKMRNNPRDWRIADVETVCDSVDGVDFITPASGSHYKVAHDESGQMVTIPAKRPIKPIYIKRFVSMLDSIIQRDE